MIINCACNPNFTLTHPFLPKFTLKDNKSSNGEPGDMHQNRSSIFRITCHASGVVALRSQGGLGEAEAPPPLPQKSGSGGWELPAGFGVEPQPPAAPPGYATGVIKFNVFGEFETIHFSSVTLSGEFDANIFLL